MIKQIKFIWGELPCANDYIAEALVWLAMKISKEKTYEIEMARDTYAACVSVATGEQETLNDAVWKCYAAVY